MDNVTLNKKQLRFLRRMSDNKEIEENSDNKNMLLFLKKYGFIVCKNDISHFYDIDKIRKYKISDKGISHLAYLHKDGFRFWLPLFLSVIAIVISMLALFK